MPLLSFTVYLQSIEIKASKISNSDALLGNVHHHCRLQCHGCTSWIWTSWTLPLLCSTYEGAQIHCARPGRFLPKPYFGQDIDLSTSIPIYQTVTRQEKENLPSLYYRTTHGHRGNFFGSIIRSMPACVQAMEPKSPWTLRRPCHLLQYRLLQWWYAALYWRIQDQLTGL